MSSNHSLDKYFYIGWTLGATNSLFMWNELNYWRNRNNVYQSETSRKIKFLETKLDKAEKRIHQNQPSGSGGEVIIIP